MTVSTKATTMPFPKIGSAYKDSSGEYTVVSEIIPATGFPDSLPRVILFPTFLAEAQDSVSKADYDKTVSWDACYIAVKLSARSL